MCYQPLTFINPKPPWNGMECDGNPCSVKISVNAQKLYALRFKPGASIASTTAAITKAAFSQLSWYGALLEGDDDHSVISSGRLGFALDPFRAS